LSGEDGVGADSPGLMTKAEFQQYCTSVRDTAVWGGEPEILALCRYFNIPIYVVQGGSPPVVSHVPTGTPNEDDIRKKPGVRISYHRRMYGLGEVNVSPCISNHIFIACKHYNSLRPKSGLSQIIPSEIRHLLS
jgi:OTU domain-containing protein 6